MTLVQATPNDENDVGAGFTPARFREGVKPSPTFSWAGVTLVPLTLTLSPRASFCLFKEQAGGYR